MPESECANIARYLLRRKFCRISEGRLVVVQSRMQTLRNHRKNSVSPEKIIESLEVLKTRKERKKQARILNAKIAFDEIMTMALGTIFVENEVMFSLASVQSWVYELMCAQWHDIKGCKQKGANKPTERESHRLIEKMMKFGLINEIKMGERAFASITEKGAVYAGLLAENSVPERLTKKEKFSSVVEQLRQKGIEDEKIRASGLQELKKRLHRCSSGSQADCSA